MKNYSSILQSGRILLRNLIYKYKTKRGTTTINRITKIITDILSTPLQFGRVNYVEGIDRKSNIVVTTRARPPLGNWCHELYWTHFPYKSSTYRNSSISVKVDRTYVSYSQRSRSHELTRKYPFQPFRGKSPMCLECLQKMGQVVRSITETSSEDTDLINIGGH